MTVKMQVQWPVLTCALSAVAGGPLLEVWTPHGHTPVDCDPSAGRRRRALRVVPVHSSPSQALDGQWPFQPFEALAATVSINECFVHILSAHSILDILA